MGGGRFEGVIPFVLLFLLLFFIHSKLYDLISYIYGKVKKAWRRYFPPKPRQETTQELAQKK